MARTPPGVAAWSGPGVAAAEDDAAGDDGTVARAGCAAAR